MVERVLVAACSAASSLSLTGADDVEGQTCAWVQMGRRKLSERIASPVVAAEIGSYRRHLPLLGVLNSNFKDGVDRL